MTQNSTPQPGQDSSNDSTPQPPLAAPAVAGAAPAAAAAEQNKDARLWGMLCHLSTFAGSVVPFGNIIGPLVIWLVKRDEFPFVDDQGKEALNFQITVMLAAIVSIPLVFVIVGIFLLIAIGICDLIFTIMAAIQANSGVRYRYPVCLRMVK